MAGSVPLTLEQIQAALADASPATAFRYLRRVPHLRSYNHNGRFYTSAEPPRFDSYGLLSLGTVRFSRDRSLAATVRRLVAEAAAGRTHKELRALLHVSVHALLRAAVQRDQLRRERMQGVFVYLSADRTIADRQRAARRQRIAQGRASLMPDPEPAVVIEVLLGPHPAPRRLPGPAGAPLARPCPAHPPRPDPGRVRPLRPRAGRPKKGASGLLTVLRAQAGEPGWSADRLARAPARSGRHGRSRIPAGGPPVSRLRHRPAQPEEPHPHAGHAGRRHVSRTRDPPLGARAVPPRRPSRSRWPTSRLPGSATATT